MPPKFPTNTALAAIMAAAAHGEQLSQCGAAPPHTPRKRGRPPESRQVKRFHIPGKIDRLAGAPNQRDLPEDVDEFNRTSRQRARAGLMRGPPDPWSVKRVTTGATSSAFPGLRITQ